MRVNEKVVLITGGAAGIGAACVDLFLREGAHVIFADRDTELGKAVEARHAKAGRTCRFVETDVSQDESVARFVQTAVDEFGRVDILYNNVGGSTARDGLVTEVPLEEFWTKMKVDLFGTWLGCRYAIPHMIAAGGGSVVNAASIVGMIGTRGRDAYTAAKGAIVAITRSMAVEYAPHKVRVNAVAAGGTGTERILKRLETNGSSRQTIERQPLGIVDPVDVANAVLYLGSDEAKSTTGHVLMVDGGLTIS